MPELPEVETIVCDLRPFVVGRRLRSFPYVNWEKTFAMGVDETVAGAVGKPITAIERRAKRIVLTLGDDRRLVVSLRMTGRLCYVARPAATSATRFVMALDRGFVQFDDARKFGRVWLYAAEEWEAESAKLGPEPLQIAQEAFIRLLRRRKGMLKALLLDQKFLAGVGNIYADEALWRARLHPRRRAETVSRSEAAELFSSIQSVLRAAIENRGTSIDDYVGGLGEQGANQNFLFAYGRAGEPCARCGGPITRIVSGQRGTHLCPQCQPVPMRKRKRPASRRGGRAA